MGNSKDSVSENTERKSSVLTPTPIVLLNVDRENEIIEEEDEDEDEKSNG
jgi:hypothetical protein